MTDCLDLTGEALVHHANPEVRARTVRPAWMPDSDEDLDINLGELPGNNNGLYVRYGGAAQDPESNTGRSTPKSASPCDLWRARSAAPEPCPPPEDNPPPPAKKKKRTCAALEEAQRQKQAAKQAREEERERKRQEKEQEKEERRQAAEARKADAAERRRVKEVGQLSARHARLAETRGRGSLWWQEIVLVVDSREAILHRVGSRVTALLKDAEWPQLDRTRRQCVEVRAVPLPPLAWLQFRWRRRPPQALLDAQERASQASQGQLPGPDGPAECGEEEEEVPYITLVCVEPADFCRRLMGDRLAALCVAAAAAVEGGGSAGASLCVLVVGLEKWLRQQDDQALQASGRGGATAAAAVSRPQVYQALAEVALTRPGLWVRPVVDCEAASEQLAYITKALAEQPYRSATGDFLSAFQGGRDTDIAREADISASQRLAPPVAELGKALYNLRGMRPEQGYKIAERYGGLGALLAAYDDPSLSQRDKERLLTHVSGIGAKTAEKLFLLLTCTDPDQKFDWS